MTHFKATETSTRLVTSPRPGVRVVRYVVPHTRGTQHRLNGPASIAVYSDDLVMAWTRHNSHHRHDGPAYTMSNGNLQWIVENANVAHIFAHGVWDNS